MAFQKVNSKKLKQAAKLQETATNLLIKGEWDRALGFYEKSLEMFTELGHKQGISIAFSNLGSLYQDKGEWDKALGFYEKSLEIREKLGDKQGISNSYNNLGSLYQNKGEWDKALKFYKKSLKISTELGDKQVISIAFSNLGSLYKDKGEWDKALEFYKKSLEIREELGDKQGISIVFSSLGSLYQDKGEWDKTLKFYEKSLKISSELGDKQGISIAFSDLGSLYQDKGEWDKALEFYKKSLEIFKELGDKQGISIVFSALGELNLKIGNWDSAKEYLEESLKIAEKLAPVSTVSIRENLGELSILEDRYNDTVKILEVRENLGELSILEDRYNDAVKILEESMNIVEDFGTKPQRISILEKFGDVYLSKYIAEEKTEIKNIELAEENYQKAFELAKNLGIPLQEATAIRGLGIIASKKGDVDKSEKCFQKSFEILRKLGASFELQKTALEYARVYYESGNLFEAEIRAKSVAFDAQKSENYELLRKAYLLLGDIAAKQKDKEYKYEYYLKSLETAKFNPKIYVRTCYHLIFRMQKMDHEQLVRFISLLKGQNDEKYFDLFLEALNNKIEGKEYKINELPSNLAQELEKFKPISVSNN